MSASTPTLTVAFVAKLVARPETAEEVATFLADAVGLANDEAGTLVWFALRTDATTFWIVDAFASEAGRQAHIEGPIAAALMATPTGCWPSHRRSCPPRSWRPRCPEHG